MIMFAIEVLAQMLSMIVGIYNNERIHVVAVLLKIQFAVHIKQSNLQNNIAGGL